MKAYLKKSKLISQIAAKKTAYEIIETREKELRKEINVIATKLCSIQQKEYEKNIDGILVELNYMLKVLNKKNYSKNEVISQFGLSSSTKYFTIAISETNNAKYTLVIIETKDNWIEHKQVGISLTAWTKILTLFKKHYGVVEHWNGNNNSYSKSIVIKKNCPKVLYDAQQRYKGFNQTQKIYDEFEKNLLHVRK